MCSGSSKRYTTEHFVWLCFTNQLFAVYTPKKQMASHTVPETVDVLIFIVMRLCVLCVNNYKKQLAILCISFVPLRIFTYSYESNHDVGKDHR